MLGRLAGDDSLPFAHHIKPVHGKIGDRLLFPIRPQDLNLIKTLVAAQPEVDAQIML